MLDGPRREVKIREARWRKQLENHAKRLVRDNRAFVGSPKKVRQDVLGQEVQLAVREGMMMRRMLEKKDRA